MIKRIIKMFFVILVAFAIGMTILYFMLMRDGDFINDQKLNAAVENSAYLANPYSGFARLNDDEKKAYIRLINNLEKHTATVKMGKNQISVENLSRVWDAINMDRPDIFWLNSYTYHYNQETGTVSDVNFNFFYEESEISRRKSEIDKVVAAIKSNITTDMDDYQKVKIVHDYIIKNTEYDLNAQDNQNICSVFMGKRSVCAGYSRALQYVLKDMGIFSSYITGNATGRGPHAWNLVQMDGDYYYIDVTWDDPSFDTAAMVNAPSVDIEYVYFGITGDEIEKNHTFDNTLGEYPDFSATKDNYYVRENKLYNLYAPSGDEEFINALRTAITGNNSLEAKFTAPGMIERALELIEESDLLYNHSIRYLRYDDNQVLILWKG